MLVWQEPGQDGDSATLSRRVPPRVVSSTELASGSSCGCAASRAVLFFHQQQQQQQQQQQRPLPQVCRRRERNDARGLENEACVGRSRSRHRRSVAAMAASSSKVLEQEAATITIKEGDYVGVHYVLSGPEMEEQDSRTAVRASAHSHARFAAARSLIHSLTHSPALVRTHTHTHRKMENLSASRWERASLPRDSRLLFGPKR